MENHEFLKKYGRYNLRDRTIELSSNKSIEDKELLNYCKVHKIKIQLNIFE